MFTTKMSMDKKSLQQRFSKIRSKNGKISKLIAIIIFLVVIAIIATSAIYVAVKKSNNNVYAMSDEDFAAYISNPIGAIMAEIDYVDNEKIVFHLGNGFFITNEQTKEIEHKIDLSKLNSALPVQADTILKIVIDKNGDYAYLESTGQIDEAQKYDSYIVDLNTGKVEIGKMPEGTELFANYGDTMMINTHGGWPSNRFVDYDNKSYYLLYRQYETIGDIQLVTIDNNDGKTDFRYVFGDKYITNAAGKKEKLIKDALAEGDSIIPNSGLYWHANADEVREIFNILSSRLNMKYKDIENDSYDVFVYDIQHGEDSFYSLFIIDNISGKLFFNLSGLSIDQSIFKEIIAYLEKNRPYMNNAEGMTYKELENLQKEVDNGHYPWRLDPEHVILQYMQEKGLKGGKVTSLAGGVTISAEYIASDDTLYRIELFRPVQVNDTGIWVVKECYKAEKELNRTAIAIKNGKLYKDLNDKSSEVADINKNDLVCVIYEKEDCYYVQMSVMSVPATEGYVKKDVLSFDADFSNANCGIIKEGTAIYNSPSEKDIYSYQKKGTIGTVAIRKRENGYCLVSSAGGIDDKWVKETDIRYEVIRLQYGG